MRRDVLVVLVFVTAAAVVLVAGIYLVLSTPPSGSSPKTPGFTGPPVAEWVAPLQKGLTYTEPILGPTTPLDDSAGGLWVINAAREGVVQMNFTGMRLGINENPFTIGGRSVRLDIGTAFSETGTPLEALYYIVPARDYAFNGTTGLAARNGAIAFFAGSDFVAADPFNRTVFLRYHLGFAPTWTGEDPASAGDMLIAPAQGATTVGAFAFPVGPYRYLWASDGTHTVVFEITYVHSGYCPCSPPSGQVRLFVNATLSAPPFVYYNQDAVSATGANASAPYRSGPGVAVVLPLANGTLEVLNTEPVLRGWVPLHLGGQSATVAGPIGYVQAAWPRELVLPVRTTSASGLLGLDLSSLSVSFEHIAGGPGWEPAARPQSRDGSSFYAAWYSSGDDRTHFVALNGTGAAIPTFSPVLPGRILSLFQVFEVNDVFAQAANGSVVTLSTVELTSGNVSPVTFPLAAPSSGTVVLYGGSPGGTRYGTLLSAHELRGAWTDRSNDTTVLFQLLPPLSIASTSTGAPAAPVVLGVYVPLVASAAAVPFTSGRRRSYSARPCGPHP